MTSQSSKTRLIEPPLHMDLDSTPTRTFATIISIILGTC
jgi:hypothetical protein